MGALNLSGGIKLAIGEFALTSSQVKTVNLGGMPKLLVVINANNTDNNCTLLGVVGLQNKTNNSYNPIVTVTASGFTIDAQVTSGTYHYLALM